MKTTRRRMASWWLLPLVALWLAGCGPVYTTAPEYSSAPVIIEVSNADYAYAQATLAAGSSGLLELSHQATVVSLNIEQAANAQAQTTLDYNQRRLLELSIQGTEISQNMERAAATQRFIAAQTQSAWDASSTAQSQALTVEYAAYERQVTQTAQAQAALDVQSTQTAQTYATLSAYMLSATPRAVMQADVNRRQNTADRRDWWEAYIYTPLIVLLVVLLIVGGVLAFRRLMPVVELRLRSLSSNENEPGLMLDGVIIDAELSGRQLPQPGNPERHAEDETPQIEIIGPAEPSIANWIIEAEQQLRADLEGTEL